MIKHTSLWRTRSPLQGKHEKQHIYKAIFQIGYTAVLSALKYIIVSETIILEKSMRLYMLPLCISTNTF